MKRPMAYRVDEKGQMTISPVANMSFHKDDVFQFQISGVGLFQQKESLSVPIGMISDSTEYQNAPYRIFECEADAWGYQIEQLFCDKAALQTEIDQVTSMIEAAVRNKALASQNETKPPE